MYKSRTFKGSYTVEASFIITITMLVIFAIIFFTFYLHDRLVTHNTCYEYILNCSNLKDLNSEAIEENIQESVYKKTFIIKNFSSHISSDNNKITISYTLDFNIPIAGINEYLKNNILSSSCKIEFKNIYKSSFIRKSKVAKDLFKKE